MDIKALINDTNQKLKQDGVRIRIKQRNRALFLVGTFPPKPGSKKSKPHQQEISLSALQAAPENIPAAVENARAVDSLLKTNRFKWEDYSPKVQIQQRRLIKDIIKEYTANHWRRAEKTPQREKNWEKHVINYLAKLPQNKEPTPEIFTQFLEQYPVDSRTRQRLTSVIVGLADLAEFSNRDIRRLRLLKGTYGLDKVKERKIFFDEELLKMRVSVEPGPARFVVEALILWGLRPYEIYLIDKMDKDCGGLITILPGGKSKRPRVVGPLFKEYFERWETWKGMPPPSNRQDKGQVISRLFRDLDLPCRPYDLRHSWAVRAMLYGNISEARAARWMGHSLTVHQRVYEFWLNHAEEKERLGELEAFEIPDDPPEPEHYLDKSFYNQPLNTGDYHHIPCPKCGSTRTRWRGWVRRGRRIYGRRQYCNDCSRTVAVKAT